MTKWRHENVGTDRPVRRRGFTLAEMMVSLSIMAVMMSAMASAVLIATHALPDGNSALDASVEAADIVDDIVEDLVYATEITEAASGAVSFTVADRSHGATGPETVRVIWSGTPGDPLTRRYNGGTIVNLCDNVQSFSLTFTIRPGPPSATSNLLFVTDDAASPSAADLTKIAKMESWGYTVQSITDSDTDAAFNTAIGASDVMYISEYVWGLTLASKPIDASIGVVFEEQFMTTALGISSSYWADTVDVIDVLDNTHDVTSGMALGTVTVCSTFESLGSTSGTLAPGAQVLANSSSSPSLVVLEAGAARHDGNAAAGRRVKLPWGGTPFSHYAPASLTADAWSITQESLAWASVRSVYTSVHIHLQIGSNSEAAVETQVQLLNAPEAD